MNKKLTEIIFLLDRSGSMAGLESDTVGGFNAFVKKQSEGKGRTLVTAVLFDDEYELLWNGVNAIEVKLTENEYFVRGMTALHDAIGKTIIEVGHRLLGTREEDRPSKVIFVIITDGMENASHEFNHRKVKELIKHQQDKYNWDFIFLGANIDVAKEAGEIGIQCDNAYSFKASKEGMGEMYSMVNEKVFEKR